MTDPITFVNVIEVDESKQKDLLELLAEGTRDVISKRPGFISVTLLASLDKTRVINVARWKTIEDVKATQSDPEAAEYAKRTAAIARAEPGLFTVAGEFQP